jgi:hypothetical protein
MEYTLKFDPNLIDNLEFYTNRNIKEKRIIHIDGDNLYINEILMVHIEDVNRIKCWSISGDRYVMNIYKKYKQNPLLRFYFDYNIGKYLERQIELNKLGI